MGADFRRDFVSETPLVVEVSRYRLDDGPGIRSVVFFKGCGLRCSFCQNPEAQRAQAEITAIPTRCIECGACTKACPVSRALPVRAGWSPVEVCTSCGRCAEACPTGALRKIGRYYRPAELAELLLRDQKFYVHSAGGITLSGGEPALFPDYLGELLPLLKAEGVHLLLQTGGHFADYEAFRSSVLPHLDVIDFSLKVADPDQHRAMSGHDNRLILNNLRRLTRDAQSRLQVSIPLVPGLTTNDENLRAIVSILRELRIGAARLLPYNPVGIRSPGTPTVGLLPLTFMSVHQIEQVAQAFRQFAKDPG